MNQTQINSSDKINRSSVLIKRADFAIVHNMLKWLTLVLPFIKTRGLDYISLIITRCGRQFNSLLHYGRINVQSEYCMNVCIRLVGLNKSIYCLLDYIL